MLRYVIVFFTGVALIMGSSRFQHIDREIDLGNFEKAEMKINRLIEGGKLNEEEVLILRDKIAVMERIRLDFRLTEDDIVKNLRPYFPELNSRQLREWEKSHALEMMQIDGRKMYFKQAHRNLFRQDSSAMARKLDIDGVQTDGLDEFLTDYLPETVQQIRNSPDMNGPWQKMKIHYSITLDADAVPAGETVSAWMPYPREDNERHRDIKLIDASEEDYIIAPHSAAQRSIYMQTQAVAGEKTRFSYSFEFSSRAQWFDLRPGMIRPYDRNSELYKVYTSEREQIRFSEEIRELSRRIVGDETNPYTIIRLLFSYIRSTYPWASAREYSTLPDIPHYVLEHGKGDCGQVTLLLMTLARYNGIPAKWQSGWMLHPGEVNLHDWAEVYFEGIGWVPVDQSFGLQKSEDESVRYFYTNGIDAYRLIVNDDYSRPFFPSKVHLRSETIDFQRGELEWRGGNLYFDSWDYQMDVEYLK